MEIRCAPRWRFYMGIPIDMLLRFEISPASVSVLELSEWGARVMCVNATDGAAI